MITELQREFTEQQADVEGYTSPHDHLETIRDADLELSSLVPKTELYRL